MCNYLNIQTEEIKMITKLISLIVLCISPYVYASGGSVIGNGAGIVESNFQYAYTSLSVTISDCIKQPRCQMSAAEEKILKSIQAILKLNISNEKRMLFVSEKVNPDLFKTGEHEVHRIAVTGLSADVPIYINTDLLYTKDGRPALDLATINGILIHELGHQTGETDHAKLDVIAAKIKKLFLESIRTHSISIGPSQETVEVVVLNRIHPFMVSELLLTWQGVGTEVITKTILAPVRCSEPDATFSGFEIYNGHFTGIHQTKLQPEIKLGFAIWINIFCYSERLNRPLTETKSVEFEFTRNLVPKVVQIQDLAGN